jgi:hypothetical protein
MNVKGPSELSFNSCLLKHDDWTGFEGGHGTSSSVLSICIGLWLLSSLGLTGKGWRILEETSEVSKLVLESLLRTKVQTRQPHRKSINVLGGPWPELGSVTIIFPRTRLCRHNHWDKREKWRGDHTLEGVVLLTVPEGRGKNC